MNDKQIRKELLSGWSSAIRNSGDSQYIADRFCSRRRVRGQSVPSLDQVAAVADTLTYEERTAPIARD